MPISTESARNAKRTSTPDSREIRDLRQEQIDAFILAEQADFLDITRSTTLILKHAIERYKTAIAEGKSSLPVEVISRKPNKEGGGDTTVRSVAIGSIDSALRLFREVHTALLQAQGKA